MYLAPAHAPALWGRLLETGAGEGIVPCGLGARDTLRFEACMQLYGNDIDDTTTPLEAGLEWIVKLDKGEFLGREALERQQAGRRRRGGWSGSRCAGAASPATATRSSPRGEQVGEVTSGTHTPTLGKALGLGYVPAAMAAPGTAFDIDIRGQRVAAEVIPTPFYRRPR